MQQQSVLKGVKQDVEALLSSFSKKGGIGFKLFRKVWREMRFHYIFSGRTKIRDTKCFTNGLFMIVKGYTDPGYTKEERVGALYMLYSLYFLQPLRKKVRIRIELQEWHNLCFFVQTTTPECPELGFCFCKLLHSLAFEYVCKSRKYTPEEAKCVVPGAMAEKKFDMENKAARVFSKKLLEKRECSDSAWSTLESDYNNYKKLISGCCDQYKLQERFFLHPLLRPYAGAPEEEEEEEPPSGVHRKARKLSDNRTLSKLIVEGVIEENEEEEVENSTISLPVIFEEVE